MGRDGVSQWYLDTLSAFEMQKCRQVGPEVAPGPQMQMWSCLGVGLLRQWRSGVREGKGLGLCLEELQEEEGERVEGCQDLLRVREMRRGRADRSLALVKSCLVRAVLVQ